MGSLDVLGFARRFRHNCSKTSKSLANPTNPKNPKTSFRKHSKTLRKIKKTKTSAHYSRETLSTKSWLHRVCCVVVWFCTGQVGLGNRNASRDKNSIWLAWELCWAQNHRYFICTCFEWCFGGLPGQLFWNFNTARRRAGWGLRAGLPQLCNGASAPNCVRNWRF